MGTPKRHLYELVHSLSPSEKQKFLERAFQHKRGRYANYVQLFNAIEEQEEFNDEAIRQRFKNEKFVRQLHQTKNYLYHRILDFIREAHFDEETELHGLLEKIKILHEKSLFHHLNLFMKKAIGLAERMEDFQARIKLLRFERVALLQNRTQAGTVDALDRLHQMEREVLHKSNRLTELQQLVDRIQVELSVPGIDRKARIGKFWEHDLLRNPVKAASIGEEIERLNSKFYLNQFAGNFNGCVEVNEKLVAIYEQYPGLLADHVRFKRYLETVYNLAASYIFLNRFPEAQNTIAKLAASKDRKRRAPVMVFEREAKFSIAFARKRLDFEDGHTSILQIESRLDKFRSRVDRRNEIEICHLAGVFYLNFAKPELALKWVLRNRNRKIDQYRPDLLSRWALRAAPTSSQPRAPASPGKRDSSWRSWGQRTLKRAR
ncbi:MAG: hypothetical protein AAF570_22390 [Bacteroidota bacterium]